MRNYSFKMHKKIFLLVLFLFVITLQARNFVYNDGVILNKTQSKIQEMANELFSKTGISAYLIAKKKLDGTTILQYEKLFAKKIKPPFAILAITLDEQKVDIYNSTDLDSSFDRKGILSPYPWEGSIIPLLTGKKKNISISAAMLNGYADMVEQLADSRDIKLKSAIGSTNRYIIKSIQYIMYIFLLIVFGWYFIKKIKKR